MRNCEVDCFCGLEVDRHFVLGRRLYRKVGCLLAFEDAINIAFGAKTDMTSYLGHIIERRR